MKQINGIPTLLFDDEHNTMVGLNRSVGSQPYSLDYEHNNMVGLNRSMGSQPYPLDDDHNNMVGVKQFNGIPNLPS